jgi:hypothetical protein
MAFVCSQRKIPRLIVWIAVLLCLLCYDDIHHGQNQNMSYFVAARLTSTTTTSESVEESSPALVPPPSVSQILSKAVQRGIGGGIPGAVAGFVQVITLMWVRTVINYQARYGSSFFATLGTLYSQGGIARFYRGAGFALIQAPVSRFVSTAANDGVNVFLAACTLTKAWGPGRTTIVAAVLVGMWRMVLMPIDTMKTVLQVDNTEGFRNLLKRVKAGNFGVLYQGAIAQCFASMLGHYPWFYTFNMLSTSKLMIQMIPFTLLRNALIGFMASIVSDTSVNAIRVVKTVKQSLGSSKHTVTYTEAVRLVVATDGWRGLFGRGLRTRIFANALQSIVFTVIWRGLIEHWKEKPTTV